MGYHQTFVLCILCIMVAVPASGYEKTSCFNSTYVTSVNLNCTQGTVIHVVQVLGGNKVNGSCVINSTQCNETIGPNWKHFTPCNGKTQCNQEVNTSDFNNCNVTAVQVKYNCINESSIVDMCLENNSTNSVIYLKSPGFPNSTSFNRQCKCNVKTEGSYMKFQILDLNFSYSLNSSDFPTFFITNVNTTLWNSTKQRNVSDTEFRQQNLDITQTQKFVELFYSNSNQSDQNLWIKITGCPNTSMTLECNANISVDNETTQISNTSTLTSTTSLPVNTTSLSYAPTTTDNVSSNANELKNNTGKMNLYIKIVIGVVSGLVVIAVIVVIWIVCRKRARKKRHLEDKIHKTSVKQNNPYINMEHTLSNDGKPGIRTSDYTEVILDGDDDVPQFSKNTLLVLQSETSNTNNNHQPANCIQKEFKAQGIEGTNSLPCAHVDDITTSEEHSNQQDLDSSVFSIKSDEQMGKRYNNAVVVPKASRKTNTSTNSNSDCVVSREPSSTADCVKDNDIAGNNQNGSVSEHDKSDSNGEVTATDDTDVPANKMEDTLANKTCKLVGINLLKQISENGARDSVPYATPADSINSKRLNADNVDHCSPDLDSDDYNPYYLPADAIEDPAKDEAAKCLSDVAMKDNELYISSSEISSKCVPEEVMEDNELYVSTSEASPGCVPDDEMEDNELYHTSSREASPKCVPDDEMEDNELYHTSSREASPKCVPDDEMEDNELYHKSSREASPKCVPDDEMEDNELYHKSREASHMCVPQEDMEGNELYKSTSEASPGCVQEEEMEDLYDTINDDSNDTPLSTFDAGKDEPTMIDTKLHTLDGTSLLALQRNNGCGDKENNASKHNNKHERPDPYEEITIL